MSLQMRRCVALVVFVSASMAASCCFAEGAPGGAPSTVVAKQGDTIVTLADVDAFSQTIPKQDQPGFFNNPKRLESLISSLLLQKQLAAEARAAGYDKEPAAQPQIELAIDEVLAKIRMDRFKAALKLPDFSTLAEEEYAGNKEKYVVPGKLDVKHILIDTKKRSEDEAKALAETVDKEAKEHPDQFDALVEKYSDDPSKTANKGLMTSAGSDRYVKEFSAAAKALKKPGEISPVIKTSYGFHVLKLVDRTADKQQSYADVREQIIAKLKSAYIDKAVSTHATEIRNRPIDANQDLVASLRDRYGVVPDPEAADKK
jgi:parvulin-like peptidyl-prolyl isomerase